MNESKPRRTYLLLPDRFVSSIVHKYRRRERKRADSGHHTNMTIDDIDVSRRYHYEQHERNNSHNNSFSHQNNNTSNTSRRSRRSNNNNDNNNNELNYSNNNSNVQYSRRSSLTTSSSSYDGENNDDNASLRSACSGMTPRTTASLAAESGMSVRLQHYQVGTPVSYALNANNANESLSSTSSSSLAPSEPPFLSSSRSPPLPNSPSTLASFPHRSDSNETNQQHRQQRQEERRSSFFRRKRPRIRQDSSNPSIANSWRIRRARASIEEDQPLPDFETQVFCATCEKWVQSRIRYRLGALTWLVAFILFSCTVILFWVPFYVKYFKDVVHYCPACGTNIGRHTKL
ncbi:LITAF-like zinc ribbon domain-containing protein [Circinella umbellata]|nr:LITAF-like zinc ribbon domain-containing protein [Circinella umbellata]